jgi:hypothetical protein
MKNSFKHSFIILVFIIFNQNLFSQYNYDGATNTSFKFLVDGSKTNVRCQYLIKRSSENHYHESFFENHGWYAVSKLGYFLDFAIEINKLKINTHNGKYYLLVKFYNKDGEYIDKLTLSPSRFKFVKTNYGLYMYSIPVDRFPISMFNFVKTVSVSYIKNDD